MTTQIDSFVNTVTPGPAGWETADPVKLTAQDVEGLSLNPFGGGCLAELNLQTPLGYQLQNPPPPARTQEELYLADGKVDRSTWPPAVELVNAYEYPDPETVSDILYHS